MAQAPDRPAPPEAFQPLARVKPRDRTFPCRGCEKPCDFGYMTGQGGVAAMGCPVMDIEWLCFDCAAGRAPMVSARNVPGRFQVTAVLGPSHVRLVRRTREDAGRLAKQAIRG